LIGFCGKSTVFADGSVTEAISIVGQIRPAASSPVGAGVPQDYTTMLRRLTSTVASGNGSRPNSDVQTVTGRPPISFADYAAKAAIAWK
jgi:hypothetical protein